MDAQYLRKLPQGVMMLSELETDMRESASFQVGTESLCKPCN
jgi:hypothetical protein